MVPAMQFHSHHNRPRHYLLEWRKKVGKTQQQVADYIGTSKGEVSRYESGIREMTLTKTYEFGEALGVGPLSILYDPEQPSIDSALKNAPAEKRRQIWAVIQAMLATI